MLYKKILFLHFILFFQMDHSSPLAVHGGGTGKTSLTAYRVLCAGTTSTGTIQVVATTPTSSQIFKSSGNTLPNFNSTPSIMIFIRTLTASASSSLTFTSSDITTNHTEYLIIFNAIVPSGAAVLNMDWSTDNGSTYLNSGYTSGFNYHAYNSTTFTNVNSTTTNPLGASNSAAFSGFIIFNNNYGIPAPPFYSGQGMYNTTGQFLELFGANGSTNTINNIKFSMSSGTITSGTITLYGMA